MESNSVAFRFSGKLARLLGEESVSSPTVAISELVKNAYDADASVCAVTFEGSSDPEMVLRIRDDGHGMTRGEIEDKWMVVGTSDKEYNPLTPSGRAKVGEKGIGRFAVQRLGHTATLISRPVKSDSEFSLTIDWDLYAKPGVTFDQVRHEIKSGKKTNPEEHGVELVISKLRDQWTKASLEDLQQRLGTIVPPGWEEKKFRIDISAPLVGVTRMTLEPAIFQEYLYHLVCDYDGTSKLTYVFDLKGGAPKTGELEEHYECGPVHFELYGYVLSPGTKEKYGRYVLKGKRLKEQLALYHGVKLFRDNFRVRPYGDPDNDWLGLDIWARNQLEAFTNDHVIGTAYITRKDNPLVDTTTREGLIQNRAYFDLKDLLTDAISIVVADRRVSFPRQKKSVVESGALREISQAANEIKSGTKNQVLISRINSAVASIEADVQNLEDQKITELATYRGLASLGLSLASVAHEMTEPVSIIIQRAIRTQKMLRDSNLNWAQSTESWEEVRSSILRINEILYYINAFSSAKERTKTAIDIPGAIKDLLRAFKSILVQEKITLQTELAQHVTPVAGFRVEFDSVLINLLTNSIEAFRDYRGEKTIKISCGKQDPFIWIRFSDSGPGIPLANREIIFEPFWTSKAKEGTGLGLTIVKEILLDYGASIAVVDSELGSGATFLIRIPLEPQ